MNIYLGILKSISSTSYQSHKVRETEYYDGRLLLTLYVYIYIFIFFFSPWRAGKGRLP